MSTTTHKVSIEIPHKYLENLLVSAVGPGGIAYWCATYDIGLMESPWFACATLTLREEHTGKLVWELDLAKLLNGVALAATQAPKAFAGLMSGFHDAEQADVIVQLAVFGEIVYA